LCKSIDFFYWVVVLFFRNWSCEIIFYTWTCSQFMGCVDCYSCWSF